MEIWVRVDQGGGDEGNDVGSPWRITGLGYERKLKSRMN